MAKGSGSGSSGVAGGGGIGGGVVGGAGKGKFDEGKHKRANDGKFSSTGGGGGGASGGGGKAGGGAKPTAAGKEVAAASGKKVGGASSAGDPAKGTGNTRDMKPSYAKTSSDRVADDLHDRVNAEYKQKRTFGNAMQRAGARKKFGDRQVVSEKEARSLKPAETEHLVANRGHEIVGTTFAQVNGVGRYIHAVRGPDGKTTVATREDVEAWLTRDPKSNQSPDALKGGQKLFKPGDLKPRREEAKNPDTKKPDVKNPDAKKQEVKPSSPAGQPRPKYEGRFGRTEVPIAGAGGGAKSAGEESGKPADKPVANPADNPVAKPSDKSVAKQPEKPAGKPVGKPTDNPAEKNPVEKPSAKPARKTPTFAAPKNAATVPAGKAKSMSLKDAAAAVESRGYQIGNPINAKLKDGSTARLYTMEDPAGRRFRIHADDVASWLETDAQKAGDPKKFGGEIVSAEKAKGKKPKSGDGVKAGVDGVKASNSNPSNSNPSNAESGNADSGKKNVVDAEVVSDSPAGSKASHHGVKRDPRASALYAEMTRPKPTMASSVAAWAASKLGMQSYAGPNGSRVMALHMKQMHDAMKENGFNPIQAYQTNWGPVIDYHHAARGLVMRIQRHAGRKGRTAMKLIGMVTGLKKAADSASIGTLIPLAAQGDGSKMQESGGSAGWQKKRGGKKSGGKYAAYLKKLEARRGDGKLSRNKLSKSFSSKGGCAMVRLPDNLTEKIIRLQASISVDDLLGFEDSPHVTVRYGVLASGEEVAGAIRGVGSVTFGLGRLDFFSSEERDVLFVRVLDNQGQLNELRRRIENCCECKQSNYSQYIPHVTVAFLKPGTAERYLSRENPLFGLDVTCYEVRYAEKGEISLEKSRDDLRDDSADFLSPMATPGKSWRISKDQGYNPHRDNSCRFASGGGASSSGGKQLAEKYSGPVDSLHAEHRKALTAMPEGARVDPTVGGRVNVNWDSDNGGGREHLDRVITAAKIQGFKSTGEEVSHDVNGDVEGRSEFFTHPDGHKLYVSTESAAGKDGEDRHAAMMVLEPPPKAKPVAASPPSNPEHAEKTSIMPQGAVVMSMKSGVTTSSWSSEGEGGVKDVNALINNAQQMGFTRESRQIERGKDGSVMSVRAVYSHPDGHRLEIDREVMADGMPPFHSVLMTLKPSAETAAARASVESKSVGTVSVRPAGRKGDLAVAKAIKQSDILAAGRRAKMESGDSEESCPHCGHKTASIVLRSPFPFANRRCQENNGGCGKEWRSNPDGTKTPDVGDISKSLSGSSWTSLPLAKRGDADAAAKFAEYFKAIGSYYAGA